MSEESLVRQMAKAIYEALDYRDSGEEWETLSDSDQQFYCGAVEDVRGLLMCHIPDDERNRPTTA